MLDINIIRNKPKLVKDNIKKKYQNEKLHLVDKIKRDDKKWRRLKLDIDKLKHERNNLSIGINNAKKEKNEKKVKSLILKAKKIPKEIEKLESKERNLKKNIKEAMFLIPNILSKKTPKGKDETKNKVRKKHGKIPKFKFKVKNHVELVEKLNIADFDASARVSGNGFYYLKNELALLNQALIRFTIDFMIKKGYTYIETPLMLNKKSIYASMDKEAIEESVYSIEGEDLNLIGTAEQSLLAMHTNDLIHEDNLPKKYFSYSMCFRKEIGSHGINEKGIWRTHQFNKIEQFIFCKPEDSEKYYDELQKNTEEIFKALKLPYRILEMCSADTADWKHRTSDIEVHRPTTKKYEELGSLSNCTDYQARKLNIRCIDKKGNKRVLHTLNNTAIATSRAMVVILENNQQKDGSIKIPKVLQPYMGEIKKIG